MVVHKNPDTVRAPQSGAYSHVAEIKSGGRLIFIAGQVGVDRDGNLPDTMEAQAKNVYSSLQAILKSEGMDFTNVVKFTTFLINPEESPAWREVAQRFTGDAAPPNTLCYIKQLAQPEFKIEVEAVAAED